MMSLHKLSAGDGYTYYISETASADELRAKGRELGDYYTVSGNPPGIWMGGGITHLGVSGTVTEAQMKALFGEGMHPDAEAMIAASIRAGKTEREAIRDARLGRGFYQYDGSETAFSRKVRAGYNEFKRRYKTEPDTDQRRVIKGRIGAEMFTAEHGRPPADKEELGRFMTASEKPKQQAVTGYDVTFAPPKSVSLLWALGGDDARKKVEKAHTDAIEAAVKHFESRGVFTRSGFNGVEQRNVKGGLIITRFRHIDSRNGDPHLHDHGVIANRVLSEDGKTWLTLDGSQLYKLNVEISEFYNAAVMQNTTQELGLATVQRDVGGNRTVTEIAGFDEKILTHASSRGTTIRSRTRALVKEFKDTHGYAPNPKQRIALAQQATLDTRAAKEGARSAEAAVTGWREEYKGAGFATGKKLMRQLAKATQEVLGTRLAPTELDVPGLAAAVLDTVSSARAVWGEHHIRAEATRQLSSVYPAGNVPEGAALAITDYALNAGSIGLNTTTRTHHAKEMYRADGASIYTKANTALFTSQAVLAAEDALLTAAQQDVIPAATVESFEVAMAARSLTGKVQLNAAQEEFARTFACSTKMIAVGIGPAGTGKTTALSLAAEAVNIAGGKVIGLATAATAADVLRKDLTDGRTVGPEQITTDTVAKFLDAHRRGKPAGLALKSGDVLIVDEAGMASTADLAKVLAIAEGAGALVRFAGDHNQLTAIGAGGALRLITHQVGAVELEEVHRFKHPDGTVNAEEAAASLVLRDPETVAGAAAFDWYRDNGRITAGGKDRMVNNTYAAWQNAVDEGKTALMMAADNTTVRELNARAQAHRVASGVITGRRSAALADDAEAHIGDTVLARQINRKLRLNQGKDFVKNGDTFRVLKVHRDGALTARHETHNGTVTLPAAYVQGHVQLGYAATFNRAQGATVDKAFAVLREGVTRAQAYVGATRGRFANQLFGILDTAADNDIINDTQELGNLLESIGNSVDRNLSAHELIDTAHTEAHSPARMRAEYINTDILAQEARVKLLLRATLGDAVGTNFINGEAFGALAHRIREAETAGLDAAGVIATAYHQRDFSDANTASAVLEWRIKNLTARSVELLEKAGDRPLANLSDAQLANLKTIALNRHNKAQTHLDNGVTLTAADGTPVPLRYPAGVQPWHQRAFGHLTDETLDTRIKAAENDGLYLLPSTQAGKIKANTWLQQELANEKELRTTLPAATYVSETAERGVLSVWAETDEEAAPAPRPRIQGEGIEAGVLDTPEGVARREKAMEGVKPWNKRIYGFLSDEALDTSIKAAENDALKLTPSTHAGEIKANTKLQKDLHEERELRTTLDSKNPLKEPLPDPSLPYAGALRQDQAAGTKTPAETAKQDRKQAGPKPRMAKDAAAGSRNRLGQAGTILERITTEEKLRTILPNKDALAEAETIKATLNKVVPEWIAPTHALAYGLATGTIAETWTAELLTARDQIAAELGWAGANLAHEQPSWTAKLGPVPSDPERRAEWENTAAQIAVFRETYNILSADPEPIPAAYRNKKDGEPQTGDELAAAVTRIHKYTAQTAKTPATAEDLAAAAATARAEQLATGRTDGQNLAAAYLRQRAARVMLSPNQQQTLDAHDTADRITGTTPDPEILTGRPNPQTPGTGPDGGEPVLVPAHTGPAETLEAATVETPTIRPADVPHSTTTIEPGALDHPAGIAATADIPVMAEPAPEPVLSRAEKATARATDYAQRLQDHVDRADAAAQARARAHDLINTTPAPAPGTGETETPEAVTATAPVHEAEQQHPLEQIPVTADPAPAETVDAPENAATTRIPDITPLREMEKPGSREDEAQGHDERQQPRAAEAAEDPAPDEKARQERAQRQDAARQELARNQQEHAQEKARKRQELIQERTRAKALRQLPGVANQPREVQDRALERLRAEQARQRKEAARRTRPTHPPQTPVAEPAQTAQEKAIHQARQQRREQARDEMRRLNTDQPSNTAVPTGAPEGTPTDPMHRIEHVAVQVHASAQAVEAYLQTEAAAAPDSDGAGHAAEDFLQKQQQPAPEKAEPKPTPAAENTPPAKEQTVQEKLAALRAQLQQTKETRPAPTQTDDAAQAALEKLRQVQKDLEKLNARQREEEQESTQHQPGPQNDGPTRRGPTL